MQRGRFISFEGIDGSGKSTQVRALAAALRGRGATVVETREPGGARGAEAIRTLLVEGAADRWSPETETLLFTAARRDHLAMAEGLFSSMGRVLLLDEKYMDAVTGLSASGIAFMYVTLESMAEGGVAAGLPREIATELAAQTMLGAARMVLETREHPAKLKDVVTTPAGTTIDGLLELESGGLRVTLIKTVVKAAKRAAELAKE